MHEHFFQILIPASGLISGLIGTYVGLQNRALLAEVHKELAELETRLLEKMNGKYVRSSEIELRERNVHDRLDALTEEVRRLADQQT